ncbi:hypothetical protein [Roseibacillus persicicus]|uniref:hypothetical protein n=1 Tax=Roseibacillus persicicus TaxID=454148 RepID=UPI00280D59E6|nr:hypothetical protein [Roseibacillus persicicus]MDQ8191420.1 hypothetical protein [Roseibacillus persicicus]
MLDLGHALELALIAFAMGSLSLFGWKLGGKIEDSPETYQEHFAEKRPLLFAVLVNLFHGEERATRMLGRLLSKGMPVAAIGAYTLCVVLVALMVMNLAGLGDSVGPVVEFLARFERGLAGN